MAPEPPCPDPPAALVRPSLSHLGSYIGPGVIIASVTIGSEELVYASRSGAIFGYGLPWCVFMPGSSRRFRYARRRVTLR